MFDPCFTGVVCIFSSVVLSLFAPALCLTLFYGGFVYFIFMSCYHMLSLVAPTLCLTPVLRVFGVSLLMSCYLLLLRHCV